MHRISNALIIDDEIDLIIQETEIQDDFLNRYKSLKNIQGFLLKNSIPFSVLTNLADSPIDAIERINDLSKPDLVVLDLDLNSNGEIDDTDINLIRIILTTLSNRFGDFIILIYSSQAEAWEEIRLELLKEEPRLDKLLSNDNVIVSEKFIKMGASINEKLSTEMIKKTNRYFDREILKLNKFIQSNWNKEIIVLSFFAAIILSVISIISSFKNKGLYVFALLIIILTTTKFIFPNKKNQHEQCNEGD